MSNNELILGLSSHGGKGPGTLTSVPMKSLVKSTEVRNRIHMVDFLRSSVGAIFLLNTTSSLFIEH